LVSEPAADVSAAPRGETVGEIEELQFHRLLVAVDGSENANLALAAAITAARRDNCSVAIISVSPTVSNVYRSWVVAGVASPERLQADTDAATERVLREAAARVPDDIAVTRLFRRGAAGVEIVAETARGNYDAVILGARGVGRVGSIVGSVSQYVVRNSPITVFVAHAPRGT
jgi:nucleotide-binding universal stress UspA family protein